MGKHFVNSKAQHKCLFITIMICEKHQIKNNLQWQDFHMDHLGKKRLIQLKKLECKLLPPNCSGMDDWIAVFLLELICSQYSHRIYYGGFFLIILSE